MSNTTFPETFEVGSFEKTNELPSLVPSDFGLCLKYSADNEAQVHSCLEQIVIQVTEQMPSKLLNIAVIDLDIRSHFPNLIQLLPSSNTFIIRDLKEVSQIIRRLVNHAREIDSLLGQDHKTLADFNQNNPRPEPYWLVIFANMPERVEADLPYLASLIENTERSGIYFLATLENEYFNKLDLKDQTKISQAILPMPLGESTDKGYTLLNVHSILETGIRNFGFRWVTGINLKAKIAELNQKIKSNENPDGKKDFLRIQIGWKGREPFYFEMGDNSGVFNGLLAGAVGTGKSTLLNNIIVQIAQNYSSDEIRLFLLDYKEGVEFSIYDKHPNVQFLSLDNQNFQFALEKIRDFEGEIRSRSHLFEIMTQQNGRPITHIDKYNAVAPQRLPRMLMIIDEVRQLFRGRSYQEIKDLKDSITRVSQQGRAYGLHLLFCSQSFNGVDLGEAMKQMQLRISFRLADFNECMYVMGMNNPTPTELAKHEIIYNTEFGSVHNPAHNQRVKTDVFVLEEDIVIILQNANSQNSNAQAFEKVVCRMAQNQPKEEINQAQESPKPLSLKEQNDKKMAELLGLIKKKN